MKLKLGIVLTGGVASGKSSVGKMLAKHGFIIVDSDKIAHDALSKNINAIEKTFGAKFIKDGEVDRKELGNLVFQDEKKRKELENILHKSIKDDIKNEIKKAKKTKQNYIVDMPLFFEKEKFYEAELKVVVYTPKTEQLRRLIKRNNLEETKAKAMIESQLDIEIKKQKADFVICNSHEITELEAEVDRFIQFLKDKNAS